MNHRSSGARRGPLGSSAGVTLTEMMVAVVVMSIGILGLVASFGSIQRSLQTSKNKTLASNLAQEKLHILMQKPYFQVIPTPNPSGTNTDFLPNISYDTVYFPVEYILQGGITYQRLTYVQSVSEDSGVLSPLAPEIPDTGMRLLTVTVIWTESGTKRKVQLNSVMSNPDSVMGVSTLTGKVKINGTATGIPGALVVAAENIGWRDSTNASGLYSIILSPGDITLIVSAPGYYTKYVPVDALANTGVNTDIDMVAVASGTVTGTAWYNPNILITQVVASTIQAQSGFAAQYIELFNPTTYDITIGGDPPLIKLNFRTGCTGTVTCTNVPYGIKLNYVNNVIDSHGYYIIANSPSFVVGGASITADAYYADTANAFCSTPPPGANWNPPTVKQIMIPPHGGSFWLTDSGDDTFDAVGVAHSGILPPTYETDYVDLGATGLLDGVQLIRVSSPSFYSSSYGRAYDSGRNTMDFTTMTVTYNPVPSAAAAQPVVAGVPAIGAVVSANDGLSSPTTAYSTGNPPRAAFSLPNVATGTWSVIISSGSRLKETDTVNIAATGSIYVFPSSTTILASTGTYGFITGTVVDVNGVALSGISISPGAAGASQTTGANGRYWLPVVPGSVDVTANPNNANPTYVSLSSSNVSASLGQITSGVSFTLSQGGRFTGFVSRDGTNALPGVAVSADDSNSISRDVQVSDINGRFVTLNVATGTYHLTPELDSLETSTPTYKQATITPGQTVDVGTFTITGALGTISGNVTVSGAPIATGVLIVVTTGTIAGSPPAPPSLSTASLSGHSYYITSSREDGTYTVDVRQSTNPVYNIYGFYYATNDTGSSPSTSKTGTAGVLSGQTTGQHNLAW